MYFTVALIYHVGVPLKTNADGSRAYLLMDICRPAGQPLPAWFMLLWGLIGLFIIIIGMKASKVRKKTR